MLILFLACAQPGDLTGRMIDARTHRVLGHQRLHAAAESAPADCRQLEAVTNEGGDFAFTGLCRGERYRLRPADPTWWIPEAPTFAGDIATSNVTLSVWRMPEDAGLYRLRDDHLEPLPTNTVIEDVTLSDGRSAIPIPLEVPLDPPTIAGSDTLVLVGAQLVDHARLLPLVASERQTIGADVAPRALDPWFTVGARFTTGGGVEPVGLPLNPEGMVDAPAGERRARYLDARAVPAGRYVLRDPATRDAWVLTFGAAP